MAEAEYTHGMEESKEMMAREHQVKAESLGNTHAKALDDMDLQNQNAEDETFLEITEHLRGKPNREARMKDMIDRLAKRQAEKRGHLLQEQQTELERLLQQEDADVSKYQARLQYQERHRKQQASKQSRLQTRRFWADGEWFTAVGEERKRLLEEEKRRQLSEGIHGPKVLSNEESPLGERPPHPLEVEGRMNNEWGVSY
jgi:chromatin segregation and condensation protein Rec8/ScpA/Scc1 (kleisin family)